MMARRVIEGAAYGPEALRVIGQAFDKAWSEIASHFDGDASVIERARLRLAYAVLAVAPEDASDVEQIKRLALEVMALNYRSTRPEGPPTSC